MKREPSSQSSFFIPTPSTAKPWLYFISGVMWSGVGVFLCSLTFKWLRPVDFSRMVLFVLGGVSLAFAIYWVGFSKFALRNIKRVERIPKEKICIFAFQKWSSYPLVIFMISLGIFLRKYSPIPKPWLATLYIGIGGSLFLASFHYFKKIVVEAHHG
jgi:hypothetical protein